MKVPQINRPYALVSISLLLLIFGLAGAYIEEKNVNDPGFFLGLLFAGWMLYNIAAYFLQWTMVFGFGGQLKPDAHSQERGIGMFASSLGVCVVMWWWVAKFIVPSR